MHDEVKLMMYMYNLIQVQLMEIMLIKISIEIIYLTSIKRSVGLMSIQQKAFITKCLRMKIRNDTEMNS